jgi:hypothetical protein
VEIFSVIALLIAFAAGMVVGAILAIALLMISVASENYKREKART